MTFHKAKPQSKRMLRRALDIGMTLLLPLLMTYELIGEATHEWIGIIMTSLLIAHHLLNRAWYAHLFKGKYSLFRLVLVILDMVLLVIMSAQAVSGIMMAKHTLEFLPHVGRRSTARVVHMLGAYWGFTLTGVHSGMHMQGVLAKLYTGSIWRKRLLRVLTVLIAVYGVYAFIQRGLPGYMSGRTQFAYFDFSEPLAFFLIDYAVMTLTFMLLGGGLARLLRKPNKNKVQPSE